MNRRLLVWQAVLLQIGLLLWMAGEREYILRTAPRFWLRTAPVDPHDLFRGDYVMLAYEISRPPAALYRPALVKRLEELRPEHYQTWNNRELKLYVGLAVGTDGLARAVSVDLSPPAGTPFLNGRARIQGYYQKPDKARLLPIDYGIEAYYVKEGAGHVLERRGPPGVPMGVQVPLEMEAAVGSRGAAVLTGHRWSSFGVGVEVKAEKAEEKSGKIVEFTLFNASPEPQRVAWPQDLSALTAVPADWNDAGFPFAGLEEDPVAGRTWAPDDFQVMPPGGRLSARIDPRDPRWGLQSESGERRFSPDDSGMPPSFRIIYRSPGLSLSSRFIGGYEFR